MKRIPLVAALVLSCLVGSAVGLCLLFWLIPPDTGRSREATVRDAEWLGGLSHANAIRRRYNPYADDAELSAAWLRGWDDQP